MLVYGQQQRKERLSWLLAQLRMCVAHTGADCLDELRAVLIRSGQLEQGIADFEMQTPAWPSLTGQLCQVTDLAATAFLSRWPTEGEPKRRHATEARDTLDQISAVLRGLDPAQDPLLTINIPEGFAFYALFPEQYCASALKWAEAHRGTTPKCAHVIGIRSIGTTLSAVVMAVLKAAGWLVERSTVRPQGQPFDRTVELNPRKLAGLRHALVVDEGPGLSGSSMAAVARVVAASGVEDISFLPGHGGEPGATGSAEVRRWWSTTPRYWTPAEELRWNGLPLTEFLAVRAEELVASHAPARTAAHSNGINGFRQPVRDLSAGRWRPHIFGLERDWPTAAPRFERAKFLCQASNGQQVLWKFEGLGGWSGASFGQQASGDLQHSGLQPKPGDGSPCRSGALLQRREHKFIAEPLGSFHGFSALPWVEGRRLTIAEANQDSLLRHIGRYLVTSAGPVLLREEAREAISRLQEMVYWNVKESLGESCADQSRCLAATAYIAEPSPSYSDGRMAPWEWVRTECGEIVKTDFAGHDVDHTLVGHQSLLWDIAGALVEWKLSVPRAGPLLETICQSGIAVDLAALPFYELAYASFRMGVCALCADSTSEGAEQLRLQRASQEYRNHLAELLKRAPDSAPAPEG